MTIAQLEAELRRIVANAKVPPSSIDQVFQGYKNARAMWAPAQRETGSRQYLVTLIDTYRRPNLQLKPAERKSLAELRQIFLSMKTKANLTLEQRTRVLDSALGSYDRSSIPQQDRDFYKRISLVALIQNMAAEPKQVLR